LKPPTIVKTIAVEEEKEAGIEKEDCNPLPDNMF
jgi:hypothetical protein